VFKEVWLAGKGPSLDTFDWSKAGPSRIAINETVFIVPKVRAVFYIDYNVADKLRNQETGELFIDPSIIIFKKKTHYAYKFENEYLYYDEVKDWQGTATIAVQVLYSLGMRKLHLIGFDSLAGNASYANSIKGIQSEGNTSDNYRRLNKSLLHVIKDLKIEAILEINNESKSIGDNFLS